MKNTVNNEDHVVKTSHPFEGLANGGERLAKAQLARQINILIQGIRQKDASELLGITQSEVSQIANGRLSGFTFDRLYRCLSRVNYFVRFRDNYDGRLRFLQIRPFFDVSSCNYRRRFQVSWRDE